MFYANPGEIISMLLAVKYTHKQNAECDYSSEPRPCHNFVFMLNGEGMVRSNGEIFRVRPGEILYIPKDSEYSAKWFASPKVAYHSLHFSFQPKFDPCKNKTIPVQILPANDFQELYSLLLTIEKYQYSKDENSFFALSAFFETCGKLLPLAKISAELPVNQTLLPAINYIERHYNRDFSVDDLAALCYLSPSRFYYLFKKYARATPVEYKNKIAVQRAAQDLLYSKQTSISEIAAKHGFSSVIYFERLFKKTTGKSPSQYRKNAVL